jgi:hypothetical protein
LNALRFSGLYRLAFQRLRRLDTDRKSGVECLNGMRQKSAVIGIGAPGETIGYPIDRCIRTVIPGKAMADIRQVKHFDCAARFT